MAIHKKINPTVSKRASEDKFLNGAPDAKANDLAASTQYDKGIPKGNKRQISITIDPTLLRKLDERAAAMGTGRSAFVSMAVFNALSESGQ
ncbi:MAG: CopG family transcriptional regulator [Candidatus Symbiopectobacterium sp. Dall1.0]|nr:CopG family transcriptional regulator [Candidatus Symbiopectobacterium sp. Dall1.0]